MIGSVGYRCGTDGGIVDPCWRDGAAPTQLVVCTGNPWARIARTIRVPNLMFDAGVTFAPPVDVRRDTPWAIELAQLESEMKKVEAALERYFDAFEAGSLTPAVCKQRVDELVARRSVLEQRKAEVEAAAAEEAPPPTDEDLAELARQTDSIIRNGDRRQVKALLQALVQRVDVESRSHVQPVFLVPAVRPPDGSVPPA